MVLNPQKLVGPWSDGHVLDLHTVSSVFLGHDSLGHPQFDTERTELGELVYRLKNKADKKALNMILEIAEQFLRQWNPPFDILIPVSPSRPRAYQPVLEIARGLGQRFGRPVCEDCLVKVKRTPELKNVFEYSERLKLLQDAFRVTPETVKGRQLLLLDDLYRSGATLEAAANTLQSAGPKSICILVLTRTRRKL